MVRGPKVSAAEKAKISRVSKITIPMKSYHARNTSAENTLHKLATARDFSVAQGDKVAVKVDDLVKSAQKYAAELRAAGKKASATSERARKVSALWERIVRGVGAKKAGKGKREVAKKSFWAGQAADVRSANGKKPVAKKFVFKSKTVVNGKKPAAKRSANAMKFAAKKVVKGKKPAPKKSLFMNKEFV